MKFDDPNYVNVCTVKSCTVAGDYVLCGGDDWNVYVWKIPKPWSKPSDHALKAFSLTLQASVDQ